MHKHLRTGFAGLLTSLALAAPAFAGPQVSVRVLGASGPLLPRTSVTLPNTPEPNTGCPANSGSSALEVATNGNWDHKPFVSTILGESHTFSNNDAWTVWVFRGGTYKVSDGICDETLSAGEELFFHVQLFDPVTFEGKFSPLWLTGVPASVTPGVPFTVTVNRVACETSFCNPGEGHRVPAVGAAVTTSVTGTNVALSGPDGKATVTVDKCGAFTVAASQADQGVPTENEPSTATCPYTIPTPGPGTTPTPTITPVPSATPDTTAPAAAFVGLKKKYKAGKGPRKLQTAVSDAGSGVADVQLAVRRARGKKCKSFGAIPGRFRKTSCKRRLFFSAGNKDNASYLLPARLQRGKYTLYMIVTDRAGNRARTSATFEVK